jgi:hypothetical protein
VPRFPDYISHFPLFSSLDPILCLRELNFTRIGDFFPGRSTAHVNPPFVHLRIAILIKIDCVLMSGFFVALAHALPWWVLLPTSSCGCYRARAAHQPLLS